ncbi:Putative deoxyribonuclease RhsC [Vibrio spartinae]|uniref:Putative deoxyribonuclease RhsC n=1 Tax=Vibrio spartinae TaxID=1918945 RepID=A0A1N6MBE8_9VIBR|nr:Putative deoxyribonuclease RhsC [Vibrio spartinae]
MRLRHDSQGVTELSYDRSGRLTKQVLPGGQTRFYEYNAYNKVTKFTDEQGRATTYDYEFPLHLVTQKTNPDGSTLQYRYDNPFHFVSAIINERGEHYQIDYLPTGHVQREVTFDGRQFVYEYDAHTQLTAKTEIGSEGTELTTRYAYDAQGKLIEKTLPDESTVQYSYDLLGNLTGVDDGRWPLVYAYDVLGRLTTEHQGWATSGYRYDALGHITAQLLPDGQQLDYDFQHGRLHQVNLNGHCLTQHHYQVSGLETRRTQGALSSHFQYDETGRLTEHRVSQAQQQTLFRRYQYNRSGNLTQVEDNLRGLTQYHYDPLDRLTQVRGSLSENFAHDPAGNLIQSRQSNVEGNRLLFQGDRHYQYDEFGNLIQEARGTNQSLVTRYQYDGQHRLTHVEKPDGTLAEYQYDAFGRRTHKTVTDKTGHQTTTEFLWQGDKLLAESGERHYQTYLYEYGSFKPLALVTGEGAENATPYFYHLDQIGTPLEITDVEGRVAWSVDYHSYGNVAYQRKAEIVSPLRFQGQYYDEETGLHYNRHRYYSPDSGRFITPDPIGLAGGLNNYQYVVNPTGWVDPLGLMMRRALCACEKQLAKSGVDGALTSKPDFYVGPSGPSSTLPSTGFRYMDSSFADQTMKSMEAPLSYFGFTDFNSGKQAREAFQIYYDKNDPLNSWSDARLKGEFDTLQLYDLKGKPQVRVPMEAGDHGNIPEPFTRYYPEYGKGGERQLIPFDMSNKPMIKFRAVKIIEE